MVRRKGQILSDSYSLVAQSDFRVRFCEVDSMTIVWHGNYVKYFEDARETFGEKYTGIAYMDIYNNGYTAPIVDMHLQYLRPLTVGERATVEIRFVDTPAAKMCFEYIIRRKADNEIAVIGSTVQVFLDSAGQLALSVPRFFEDWKKRWLK